MDPRSRCVTEHCDVAPASITPATANSSCATAAVGGVSVWYPAALSWPPNRTMSHQTGPILHHEPTGCHCGKTLAGHIHDDFLVANIGGVQRGTGGRLIFLKIR